MKKLPLFLFIGAVGFLIYALVYLDGGNVKIKTGKSSKTEAGKVEKTQSVKKAQKVHEFEKIEVNGIFDVVVTYGSKEKIVIESPDKRPKEIKLEVESGTLMVKLNRNTSLLYRKGAKIHVYTEKLNDFVLEGAASITLNNTLIDHSFSTKLGGAATFKGDVDVAQAEIELEGGSSIELSGKAKTASLDLSGASKLTDYGFNVNHLSVQMNGLSNANITCSESLEGKLSGISKLSYDGNPTVENVKTSGSASFRAR